MAEEEEEEEELKLHFLKIVQFKVKSFLLGINRMLKVQ